MNKFWNANRLVKAVNLDPVLSHIRDNHLLISLYGKTKDGPVHTIYSVISESAKFYFNAVFSISNAWA